MEKRRALSWGAAAILLVAAISLLAGYRERQQIRDHIQIHVIDVGQADCMVIKTPQGNVMIDTGTDLSEHDVRAYLRSEGIARLDYLVLSHPHDDHVGNADMILREFEVAHLVCAQTTSTEMVWLNVVQAADEVGEALVWIEPTSGTTFWVGDVRFEVLMAPTADNKGENDDSLIIRMDHGACSLLLTGDAEAAEEAQLLESVPTEKLRATMLKVGHHGSSGSSTEAFLAAVAPQIALISAGEGNAFSHPHRETLARLEQVGAQVFCTDTLGTMVFVCDGRSFDMIRPR